MSALGWYARLLVLVVVAQFYLAGLALFGGSTFVPHAITGWVIILLALSLTIGALMVKARRTLAPLAIGILLLSVGQPAIVLGLRRWPAAAALHPVVGIAIVGLLILFARRARETPSRA
jgi:hypothetical protein